MTLIGLGRSHRDTVRLLVVKRNHRVITVRVVCVLCVCLCVFVGERVFVCVC